MATLPVYLSNIKSSGVYTFEFDKSAIVTTTTATLRLLIGFSKTGPFNTPVFCQDTRFFNEVFGTRDKQLEKQGSYFHLSALEMLSESPIIALNLLNLDAEKDKTGFVSFSASSTERNQVIGSAPLSGFFDSTRFWKLDTEKVLKNIDNQEGFTSSLINFANVGKSNVSIIVTKGNIQGLDISAKDWYGEADVPEFMDASDYINDYTVRVNIVKGDITDFQKLSVDPILGDYFDTNGIKKVYTDTNGNQFDGLVALLENPNVVSLGEFVGSLIPNFVDRQNNNIYIQDLINLDTPFTGVYCSVDEGLFDSGNLLSGSVIDLIGGTLEGASASRIDFLSYIGNTSGQVIYDEVGVTAGAETIAGATFSTTDEDFYVGDLSGKFDTIEVPTDDFVLGLKKDSSWIKAEKFTFTGTASGEIFALVKDIEIGEVTSKIQIYSTTADDSFALAIDDSNPVEILPYIPFVDIDGNTADFTITSNVGSDFRRGIFGSSDTVQDSASNFIPFTVVSNTQSLIGGIEFSQGVSIYTLTAQNPLDASNLIIQNQGGSIKKTFEVSKVNDFEFTFEVGATYSAGDIQPSDFIIRGFEDGVGVTNIDNRTGGTRFTRIRSVQLEGTTVTVKTFDPVYFENNDTVTVYKSIDSFVSNYNAFKLKGFTLREEQMPNGTAQRQNEILGVLKNTGLFDALVDKNNISFRYIVDSFDGTIEGSSKSVLSSLCKQRKYAFAILNAPSVKKFSESTNPLFKFDNRSEFDPRYIATGGNQQLNPTNTFSLPTLNQGSNYCGFFHPYMILREGPTTKLVPPAAYVSNNFVAKYKVGTPYDIIAGPRRGVVAGTNVIGVEYIYDRKGLDVVEPFGLNVIVPTNGIGNVINANQTAQQNIKSALSSIHVRELLIYIQETVEQILANYRWEFNTPQTRLEIKTLVDGFLGRVLSDGGLTDFETVMNTVNNTPDVIDNDKGIIDIAIEPVRGLSKLVQRYTILKTGGIAAGDFQIQ